MTLQEAKDIAAREHEYADYHQIDCLKQPQKSTVVVNGMRPAR